MRCGHTRPVGFAIAATRQCAANAHTRRYDIDPTQAVIGKACQAVGAVAGPDCDNIVQLVTRGIERRAIVVDSLTEDVAIARGRDEQDARIATSFDRVLECNVRTARLAPTVVKNANVRIELRSHHARIIDRGDGRGRVPLIVHIQKFQCHDRTAPIDTGHTSRIIPDRADGSSHVGAVS